MSTEEQSRKFNKAEDYALTYRARIPVSEAEQQERGMIMGQLRIDDGGDDIFFEWPKSYFSCSGEERKNHFYVHAGSNHLGWVVDLYVPGVSRREGFSEYLGHDRAKDIAIAQIVPHLRSSDTFLEEVISHKLNLGDVREILATHLDGDVAQARGHLEQIKFNGLKNLRNKRQASFLGRVIGAVFPPQKDITQDLDLKEFNTFCEKKNRVKMARVMDVYKNKDHTFYEATIPMPEEFEDAYEHFLDAAEVVKGKEAIRFGDDTSGYVYARRQQDGSWRVSNGGSAYDEGTPLAFLISDVAANMALRSLGQDVIFDYIQNHALSEDDISQINSGVGDVVYKRSELETLEVG